MDHYDNLRLVFKFSRLAILFSFLCIAQTVVLCIGADGHIEVELPLQQSCGSCVDVPLFYSTLAKEVSLVEENLSRSDNTFFAGDISCQYAPLTTIDQENQFNTVLPPLIFTHVMDLIVLRI